MKAKTTRRALLMSSLSLLLCVSMLVGTTFAWFTDSVTSTGNIIKSGTLEVKMYYGDDANNLVDVEDETLSSNAIFDYKFWEPGFTQTKYIKAENVGDLAFKYQLRVVPVNPGSDGIKLAEAIDVYCAIVDDGSDVDYGFAAPTRDTFKSMTKLGSLKSLMVNPNGVDDGVLLPLAGAEDKVDPTTENYKHYVTVCLALHMREEAGNEYQNLSIGDGFDVVLNATQMTYEKDDYGPDYDDGVNVSGSASDAAPEAGTEKMYMVYNVMGDTKLAQLTIHSDAVSNLDEAVSISVAPTNQDPNVTVAAHQNAATFNIEVTNIKEGNQQPIEVVLNVGKNLDGVQVFHRDTEIQNIDYNAETGFVTFTTTSFSPYTVLFDKPLASVNNDSYNSIYAAFAAAQDGDVITLRPSYNTQDAQLTETIVVDKEITLIPNGMYLVSSAPATFTVNEGGKLTVEEGSFTIKNTATNGAAALVNGGEFVMKGGSFDAHTAVRTTAGKSSVATLAAGWSNRVTVGFDLKGNDTVNVTGGSLYTGKEAILTAAGTHTQINMQGGLLSSGTTQYSAAVELNGTANINMTGGTIAATYSSGLNGSTAIEAMAAPTVINLSGTAKLEAKGWGVALGSHWSSPAVLTERFKLNVSGDAVINVPGSTGFGIRYCQDACDVTVSGNAKVNATFHAIQMNSNSYLFTNSTLTIADNAKITSTAGRYGGGYAVAAYGNVTITGGTLTGSTLGLGAYGDGAVVVIDNSVTGTPITINSADIGGGVDYTVAGNPTIG